MKEIEEVIAGTRRWTVIEGDCLDVLPTIPAGAVDAVVTDPPYGINHSSNHGASWQRTTIHGDGDTEVRDTALALFDTVAAFGTWKSAPIEGCRAALVWDKGREMVYIRGELWSGRRDEGVLRSEVVVSWESRGRVHPHQKPVGLIRQLLDKLPQDIVVLDPFCGSGTTGVACIETGRRFIGIEIDPKYAAIARNRLEQTSPYLFVQGEGA